MLVAATYVSVWDDDVEIRTLCTWDTQKRVAPYIEAVEVTGIQVLVREYVELPGGVQVVVDSALESEDGVPAVAGQQRRG